MPEIPVPAINFDRTGCRVERSKDSKYRLLNPLPGKSRGNTEAVSFKISSKPEHAHAKGRETK